jgi:hypothetical protein
VRRVKDGLSVGRRARARGGRGWASEDAERPGKNERHDVDRGLWSQVTFSEEGCEKTTKRMRSGRAAWIGVDRGKREWSEWGNSKAMSSTLQLAPTHSFLLRHGSGPVPIPILRHLSFP